MYLTSLKALKAMKLIKKQLKYHIDNLEQGINKRRNSTATAKDNHYPQ